MARTFDLDVFLADNKAKASDVKAGTAKVCTARDCACGNVPLMMDAFYRDKSQANGRSPWCKAKERAYNASYYGALKAKGVEAPRKRDIGNDKGVATFERRMKSERVTRGKKSSSTSTTRKRTANAKTTTKARKVVRKAKATVA